VVDKKPKGDERKIVFLEKVAIDGDRDHCCFSVGKPIDAVCNGLDNRGYLPFGRR